LRRKEHGTDLHASQFNIGRRPGISEILMLDLAGFARRVCTIA
jgi:hypothetical protein